jgi:hypothetical protein
MGNDKAGTNRVILVTYEYGSAHGLGSRIIFKVAQTKIYNS